MARLYGLWGFHLASFFMKICPYSEELNIYSKYFSAETHNLPYSFQIKTNSDRNSK